MTASLECRTGVLMLYFITKVASKQPVRSLGVVEICATWNTHSLCQLFGPEVCSSLLEDIAIVKWDLIH